MATKKTAFLAPTLGDTLTEIMGERGMSQAELARASGVSAQLIGQIQKGGRPNNTVDVLLKLAHALEVGLDELAFDYSQPVPAQLKAALDSGKLAGHTRAQWRKLRIAHVVRGSPLSMADYIALFHLW